MTQQSPMLNNQQSTPLRTQNTHQKSASTSSVDLAAQYSQDIQQINRFLFREVGDKGQKLEKYKAHVRVIEDSKSPSQRPPVNSAPKNKKPRILILSVKSSGRIRLHKARENPDGSVQIGRTWDFDELTTIELDTEVPTGFTFEMGKSYYWETNSPKERRVWLTSILKDQIKYTNGKKIPNLVNCSLDYFHLQGLVSQLNPNGTIAEQSAPGTSGSSTTNLSGSRSAGTDATSPLRGNINSSLSRFEDQQAIRKGSKQQLTTTGSALTGGRPLPGGNGESYSQTRRKSAALLPDSKNSPDVMQQRTHQRQTSAHSMEKFESLTQQSSKTRKASAGKSMLDKQFEDQKFVEQQRLQLEEFAARKLEKEKLEKLQASRERELELARQSRERQLEQERQTQARELEEQRRQLKERELELQRQAEQKALQEQKQAQLREIEEQRQAKQRELEEQMQTRQAKEQEESIHKKQLETNQREQLGVDDQITRTLSGNASLRSIEFVAHRKSMLEIENLTSSRDSEYDDLFADYADSTENEIQTAPLNIGAVGSTPKVVEAAPKSLSHYNASNDFDMNTSTPTIRLTSEVGGLSNLDSDDEDYEPITSGPNARFRALSRAESVGETDNFLADLFEEIGWDSRVDDSKSLMKKLTKELERLEFQKVNALTEATDNISSLDSAIQRAILGCDAIDPILSFFGVQLASFQDDIDYVEKQSQGLQVETANKKLLKKELDGILHSVDVSDTSLKTLENKVKLGEKNQEIEEILNELYHSITKIRGTGEEDEDEDYGTMKALEQKRDKFELANQRFIDRFKTQISKIFSSIATSLNSHMQNSDSLSDFITNTLPQKLADMLTLNGLLSYVKQMSTTDFFDIMSLYEQQFVGVFDNLTKLLMDDFRKKQASINTVPFSFMLEPKYIVSGRADKPKSLGFSSKPKQTASSKFFAELGLNATSSSTPKSQDLEFSSKISEEQKLTNLLVEFLESYFNVIITQHKFVVCFFSLTTSSTSSFQELIKQPINSRTTEFLNTETTLTGMEPDRDVSDAVFGAMHRLFHSSSNQVVKSVSAVCKGDMLQCPIILRYVEESVAKLSSTSQEYAVSRLSKISTRLLSVWKKDIEKQSSLIDQQTIDCRVFNFTKAFPEFVRKIEQGMESLKVSASDNSAVYHELSEDYQKIWDTIDMCLNKNTSLYEHLTPQFTLTRQISVLSATEEQSGQTTASEQPLDEIMSNHLMLLINYKWLNEELKDLKTLPIVTKTTIDELRSSELTAFCDLLSRRASIGELMIFVKGVEDLTESGTDPSKTNAYSPAHLKSLLRRFESTNLKISIQELTSQLNGMIIGKLAANESEESEVSLKVATEIERLLYNDCLNSLGSIYNTCFSRLALILNKYNDGVLNPGNKIDNPVDKRLINYNFNKEYL
ncbi:hypothetical protein CANARDRAFT_8701 [[Candida] arabinofermentans NRRL YB-2248]|uniref:Exocyst complex component Sec3 PIP2-binding N-terminal domain-containing protein n=1 Tax=[Candida] arabinofermentans NRRL YB-2248 TaxID=983967 RepID=A0A1E4SXY2_9ASCO|nr:hypothetical protein CANARDRAFT_8701 [[Candida] arabinofermentans NRRL YB-2248]